MDKKIIKFGYAEIEKHIFFGKKVLNISFVTKMVKNGP